MARFTQKISPTVASKPTAINYGGGQAYEKSAKTELVGRLMANFLQSTFYERADVQLNELVQVAHKVQDPLFLAKASVYARNVFGMRSVTHVVAAVVAKMIRDSNVAATSANGKIKFPATGKPWFKRYFDKVVARPDDMVEIMSYFLSHYKKPIPNSLKKGFADAFGRFDRYQLAKYRMEGKELTLRKLAKLVWPTITDKNRDAIADLWAGNLASTGTWEAKLSEAGQADTVEQVEEAKSTAWKNLILEEKIAQFALLRNLRNIVQQTDSKTINAACSLLVKPSRIKDSKILPFRYYTAYKELSGLNKAVSDSLQCAFDIACCNVPDLSGKTLVALDVSGSMQPGWGRNKNNSPFEIGALFAGVIAKSTPGSDLAIFSNDCKQFKVDPNKSVFETVKAIEKVAPFGGTSFNAVFKWIESQNTAYDRIIFLSDGEAWGGYTVAQKALDRYNQLKGTDTKMYFFDLAGGKTLQFKENKLFYIPGFSEKVFDLMDKLERGVGTILTEIEAVQI